MDRSRLAFCVRISGWTLCVNSSDFIYCSNIPLAIVSIVIETTRIVHHGRTRRTPFVKWTGHEMGKCFCAETRTSTYLNSHRLNELVLGNELWFYVWPSKSTALKTDRPNCSCPIAKRIIALSSCDFCFAVQSHLTSPPSKTHSPINTQIHI